MKFDCMFDSILQHIETLQTIRTGSLTLTDDESYRVDEESVCVSLEIVQYGNVVGTIKKRSCVKN